MAATFLSTSFFTLSLSSSHGPPSSLFMTSPLLLALRHARVRNRRRGRFLFLSSSLLSLTLSFSSSLSSSPARLSLSLSLSLATEISVVRRDFFFSLLSLFGNYFLLSPSLPSLALPFTFDEQISMIPTIPVFLFLLREGVASCGLSLPFLRVASLNCSSFLY